MCLVALLLGFGLILVRDLFDCGQSHLPVWESGLVVVGYLLNHCCDNWLPGESLFGGDLCYLGSYFWGEGQQLPLCERDGDVHGMLIDLFGYLGVVNFRGDHVCWVGSSDRWVTNYGPNRSWNRSVGSVRSFGIGVLQFGCKGYCLSLLGGGCCPLCGHRPAGAFQSLAWAQAAMLVWWQGSDYYFRVETRGSVHGEGICGVLCGILVDMSDMVKGLSRRICWRECVVLGYLKEHSRGSDLPRVLPVVLVNSAA